MGRGPVGAPAIIRYVNNSVSEVDSVSASAGLTDDMVLIKTLTASSSGNLAFVNGTSDVVLDSTYPIYKFVFINIHPGTSDKQFTFNLSVDTGSNYNVTKTTSSFEAYHEEDGGSPTVSYNTSRDLAQGTGYQVFNDTFGSVQNDHSLSGELWLFNPSSTTYIKHFMIVNNQVAGGYLRNFYIAGYGNTTSAVDAVQFKMTSGNIDAGTIKLYGIKDS